MSEEREYLSVVNGRVYKAKYKPKPSGTKKRGRKPSKRTMISKELVNLIDNDLVKILEMVVEYKKTNNIDSYDIYIKENF